jgi:hypothetical protein
MLESNIVMEYRNSAVSSPTPNKEFRGKRAFRFAFENFLKNNGGVSKMATEGVRRLSLLLGIFGCIGWAIFVLVSSEGLSRIEGTGWIVASIGLPVCFYTPLWTVRGIAWVVEGFNKSS